MKTLRNVIAVMTLGLSAGGAFAADMSTEGMTFSANNPAVVVGVQMVPLFIAKEVEQMQGEVANAPVVPVPAAA